MTFPDARKAALSYSFDDGMIEHTKIAAPLLAKYGFRGTFFIIPGLTEEHEASVTVPSQYVAGKRLLRKIAGWEDWRQVAAMGHEIGNHSWSHPLLWNIRKASQVDQQIVGAKVAIERKLRITVHSWAWPYYRTRKDQEKIVAGSHSFARKMDFQLSFSHTMTQQRANRWIDKAIEHRGHFIVVLHGIGNGVEDVTAELLEDNLRHARCREKEIWVAPCGEVDEYLKCQ